MLLSWEFCSCYETSSIAVLRLPFFPFCYFLKSGWGNGGGLVGGWWGGGRRGCIFTNHKKSLSIRFVILLPPSFEVFVSP